jgi:UDP-2,3-diacylglucosamine pyrophosphatase LpxH
MDCTAVVCGHTHVAAAKVEQPIPYFNSGCWTEWPGTYLTVNDGRVTLEHFTREIHEQATELDSVQTESTVILEG